MKNEIDAKFIKNWIKENLKSYQQPKTSYPDSLSDLDNKIKISLSHLYENTDLQHVNLREVATGKKFLRRIRKILQLEVLDWTLSPFLEKQTHFNLSLSELIDSFNKKQEEMESELKIINSSLAEPINSFYKKQEEIESELKTIDSSLTRVIDSFNKKQEEIDSKLKIINLNLAEPIASFYKKKEEIESELKIIDSKINLENTEQKNRSIQLENKISDIKKELVRSEIIQAFHNILKREVDKEALEYYTNEILANKLTVQKLYDILRQSEEHSQLLKTQEQKEILVVIKKMNDMVKYSNKYEEQITSKSPNAICYADVSKISYYNELPMSERFDEYLWVLENLNTTGNLLDVGCSESIFAQELTKINSLNVFGIDIRQPEYTPQFTFFLEDCNKTHFDDGFFDQITVVSSIEHFGLDFYGNKILDEDSDFKSMKELRRILKNNGLIFLTLPYGKESKSWYRKYDEARLEKLLDGFEVLEIKILKQTHIGWEETTAKSAMMSGDSLHYADLPGAVVFIKGRKTE
ncbi:MAG TPA: DUF268 domain-containing protein [Nitrosopumilaceae archaeon]|nr:DUF268 domain-containing protein [Nitrosopumilaceae archaeon]